MRSRKMWAPTDRDIDIIRFIHRMGWANTQHITRVLFIPGKPKTKGKAPEMYLDTSAQAVRRMKLLYDNKLVGRIYPLIKRGEGLDPLVYYCDKKAYEGVLKGQTYISAPNMWSDDYLHDKTARDMLVNFLVGARIGMFSLTDWKSERTLNGEYSAYVPDGYVEVHLDGGNPHRVFLEVDMGKESEKKWKDKITRMVAYLDSPEYKAIYEHHRVRIAIATTTTERATTLRRWTEEMKVKSRFWFTTFDRFTASTAFDSSIWMLCQRDGFYPFSQTA